MYYLSWFVHVESLDMMWFWEDFMPPNSETGFAWCSVDSKADFFEFIIVYYRRRIVLFLLHFYQGEVTSFGYIFCNIFSRCVSLDPFDVYARIVTFFSLIIVNFLLRSVFFNQIRIVCHNMPVVDDCSCATCWRICICFAIEMWIGQLFFLIWSERPSSIYRISFGTDNIGHWKRFWKAFSAFSIDNTGWWASVRHHFDNSIMEFPLPLCFFTS